MGCFLSCLHQIMTFFRKNPESDQAKLNLERKLYLARESPEPVFDISECGLRDVPPGIYSICKVFRKEQLLLNDNELSSFDGGGQVRDLFLLKVLNISNNKFSQITNDVQFLINLSELYIQNNFLKYLPDSIQYLKSLRILDISNNKLRELTPAIGKLKQLRLLKLTGNQDLKRICLDLCHASNLHNLEFDKDNVLYPPEEILQLSTKGIMKFLCEQAGIEYIEPLDEEGNISEIRGNFFIPNLNQLQYSWEDQQLEITIQENRLQQESKQQRELMLSKVLKEQTNLDAEIARVQDLKDEERKELIKAIQNEEKEIEIIVRRFNKSSNLDPAVIQQQLAHEQSELDRLLQITKQSHNIVRNNDILKAMENLIEQNYSSHSSKKNYNDHLMSIQKNILLDELECSNKLQELLQAKDKSRTALMEQMLEDQDIQKALVASLLEQVDARSWGLNQEIALITSNLAKLSMIEQEKQKLQVTYNYNQLLDQRIGLLNLLDDLLSQQNKRRLQLVDTIKDMEKETDCSSDFWLRNYQKLIDSAPKTLLGVQRKLDPQFANNLLEEGVIHCLPFLVKFIFSENSLLDVTNEMLKKNGVTLSSDREGILKAINGYINLKIQEPKPEGNEVEPTAPVLQDDTLSNMNGVVDSSNSENVVAHSECVICMDSHCEVVFVPCGHLCCCLACSDQELGACPMCRSDIEKKIKVLIP